MTFMEDATAKTPLASSGTIRKDAEAEIKELQETVESLKIQIKEMHANLLEAAVLNNKYIQTVQEYQKQIEQLKKPPVHLQRCGTVR